jgi:hypothetical protein
MRIVKKGEKAMLEAALAGRAVSPVDSSKTVEFGKEDAIIVIVLVLLTVGYLRGQLTIQDFLSYLGITGAGGLWRMIGGTSSSK